jgi:hypothetical protein
MNLSNPFRLLQLEKLGKRCSKTKAVYPLRRCVRYSSTSSQPIAVSDVHPLSKPPPDIVGKPLPGHAASGPGDEPIDVTFPHVIAAAYRIRNFVPHTSVHFSAKMSAMLGCKIYFKSEYALPTGSFKERGGRNALMQLDPGAAKRGVIAASAGK